MYKKCNRLNLKELCKLTCGWNPRHPRNPY
nr:MAG TPA: hypothetical protein [Caudoviricetes sp.]